MIQNVAVLAAIAVSTLVSPYAWAKLRHEPKSPDAGGIMFVVLCILLVASVCFGWFHTLSPYGGSF
jgi:hypothetical protein